MSERSGEAKTAGRSLHRRKNNNNNFKNHMEQSVRTSAFFILLYHRDNFNSQQISSLEAPGKKLVLLPLTGSDQTSTEPNIPVSVKAAVDAYRKIYKYTQKVEECIVIT